MSTELGCAQNPDGSLKEASEISFTHSRSASPVDLSTPLPSVAAAPALTPVTPTPTVSIKEVPEKPSASRVPKPRMLGKRSSTAVIHSVQKRVRYTTGDKLEVLEFILGPGQNLKDEEVADHFRSRFPKINQSMVWKWRNEQQKIRSSVESNPNQIFYKRTGIAKAVKFPKLEEMLVLFVRTSQDRLKISAEVLRVKVKQFADMLGIPLDEQLSLSNGWVTSFKDRNGIREYKLHGEAASVAPEAVEAARERLKVKLASFSRRDVYNFDETGLFYRMPPDKSLATQQMSGGKGDKTRISLGFIANADGSDIREPLFIGHARRPRCFNKKDGYDLGFMYYYNKKAWMTGIIFELFLEDLDKEMRQQNRNVCLTIDNAPSHIFDALILTNVEVIFLDPNMTSHIQPMDAGIIRAFKAQYRRLYILLALDRYENGEQNIYHIDQLQAMNLVNQAWAKITSETVSNCWKHAGILNASSGPIDPAINGDSGINQAVTELAGALKELSVQAIASKNVPTVEELLNIDAEDITEAEWTDAEILQQVEISSREASGEHIPELEAPGPEPEPLMGLPEACNALTRLDQLFQSEAGPEYAQARVLLPKLHRDLQRRINRSMGQSDLRSFFRKET